MHTDMLAADDVNHARQRRIVSHAFSVEALKAQEKLTTEYVDLFISKIGEVAEANKGVVDLNCWYNYFTFDIIGEMAFGESFQCMVAGEYNYWVMDMPAQMVASAKEQCTHRIAGVHTRLQKLLKKWVVPTGMKDHLAMSTKKVTKRLEAVDWEKKDFLWFITRQKESGNISRAEIIANAALFIFAGSETTASLCAGMTHWLLKTPRVLEKLQAEIRTIETAEELVQERLGRLPYLSACIDEALRIFPPVPGSNLRVVPTGGAKVCGYDLPAGTTVGVQSWSATHDPANFPQPFEMIPERWLGDGEGPKSQLQASQPFSLGPRGCLGKNLAYLEARLAVSKLLWSYDIEYAQGTPEWVPLQSSKSILAWLIWHTPSLNVKLTARR
ncbi:hypothetical protein LTS10_000252 [Elasticomyces elasticus]|nr:hypothetical protein LTS10_000252 [Elasticomyces elasticus]